MPALVRSNLKELFRELVQKAMEAQDVRSTEDSEYYLVTLLERFARPRQDWFDKPLALEYLESFHTGRADRYQKLKKVADTSLFVSGIFLETVERTLVGTEYYIRLGRTAYGHLALESARPFGELSEKFREFVRVLSEISFSELFRSEHQVVRLYTRWLRTGSRRDYEWLMRRGLVPVLAPEGTRH
ncbi:MAG: hypothetical protein KatS3mg076_1874 [Candidatus Binatia bacterium]|nr:MAG: hypothetical protein KatS3mg076_1874 [Candidatus Binatia bacterium]